MWRMTLINQHIDSSVQTASMYDYIRDEKDVKQVRVDHLEEHLPVQSSSTMLAVLLKLQLLEF